MVHYVFWLFSGGTPTSQPAGGGGGGGFPKPPSQPAAARRSSFDSQEQSMCRQHFGQLGPYLLPCVLICILSMAV